MKRLGWLSFFLLLAALPAAAQSYAPDHSAVIVDSRRTQWKDRVGLDSEGGIPTYSSVTCGTVSEGDNDNGPEINACIAAAANNTAVLIPAGVYPVATSIVLKSRVALRGAGAFYPWMPGSSPTSTELVLNNNSRITVDGGSKAANWSPTTGGRAITAGYTKDSTVITVSSTASVVAASTYIAVFEDNDPGLINTGGDTYLCEGGSTRCRSSYHKVTGVSGLNLTISPPIPFVGGGTNPGYRIQTMGISMAGVENIKLRGTAGETQCFLIFIEFARHVWLKNVETYHIGGSSCSSNSSHVWIVWSYGVEIRDSYFHKSSRYDGGMGYGITMHNWNSHHKIENNIIQECRHSIAAQMTAVTYVGYNWTSHSCGLPITGQPLYTDITQHGAWPHMILYEGNQCSNIVSDIVHGNAGYNTVFRNWCSGERMINPSTATSRNAFQVQAENYHHNFVGNVAGLSAWTTGTALDNNTSTTTPKAFLFGRGSGGINSTYTDTQAFSTADWGTDNSCSNYDYITDGITGGHTCALPVPPSLYYAARPTFFGNMPWPLFGYDVAGKVGPTPAKVCFDANQMPNCLVGTSSNAPATPSNLVIQ